MLKMEELEQKVDSLTALLLKMDKKMDNLESILKPESSARRKGWWGKWGYGTQDTFKRMRE